MQKLLDKATTLWEKQDSTVKTAVGTYAPAEATLIWFIVIEVVRTRIARPYG